MNKTLVIGYGNTVRGDDGAGIAAVGILKKYYPHFDFLSIHQLTPELSETMSNYQSVYFIDASVEVAEVTKIKLQPEISTGILNTHVVSPQNLLNTCLHLYGKIPSETILFHIPAYHYGFSEELSVSTQERIEELVVYLSASVGTSIKKI